MKNKILPLSETRVLSLETMYKTSVNLEVVSAESFASFIDGVVDSVSDTIRSIIPYKFVDKAYKDATILNDQVKKNIDAIKSSDMADIYIVVPAGFEGSMLSYSNDLAMVYNSVVVPLDKLIKELTTDIGTIINQNDFNEMTPPASIVDVRKLLKVKETMQAKLGGYFRNKRNNSNAAMIDVFKNPMELIKLHDSIKVLERTCSALTLDDVINRSDKLAEYLEDYIVQLKGNSELVKNSRAVKEVSEVLYNLAELFTYVGYLQENILQLYGSVDNINKAVLEVVG